MQHASTEGENRDPTEFHVPWMIIGVRRFRERTYENPSTILREESGQ